MIFVRHLTHILWNVCLKWVSLCWLKGAVLSQTGICTAGAQNVEVDTNSLTTRGSGKAFFWPGSKVLWPSGEVINTGDGRECGREDIESVWTLSKCSLLRWGKGRWMGALFCPCTVPSHPRQTKPNQNPEKERVMCNHRTVYLGSVPYSHFLSCLLFFQHYCLSLSHHHLSPGLQ